MSAPNSSDQPSDQLRALVEGLNNFVCSDSDSGSDDGFVFTAVTTQQARDFISGKGKSDIVLGKGKSDIGKGDIGKGEVSKGNVIVLGKGKSKDDIGKGEVIVLGKGKSKD